jgi:hypothetical protein
MLQLRRVAHLQDGQTAHAAAPADAQDIMQQRQNIIISMIDIATLLWQ